MTVWMKVTDDKYELPLIIADTCSELECKCGVQAGSIRRYIHQHKTTTTKKHRSIYHKVVIEEGEGTDVKKKSYTS